MLTFALLMSALTLASSEMDPLSDEFINLINSKQSSWKAGRNFPINTPLAYFKNLMGAKKVENLPDIPEIRYNPELTMNLPENFDSREKWPYCLSLNEIRDQGSCGSGWALAVVAVMTDRYCIYSNGKKHFYFSAEDLLSCCRACGSCKQGSTFSAWFFLQFSGVVSGGNYNSSQGCRPYAIPPCEHHNADKLIPCGERVVDTPECIRSCDSSSTDYYKDKRYSKYTIIMFGEEATKESLFRDGPVTTEMIIYTDFLHYKDGVYNHVEGEKLGIHAIKIIGWGVENGENYWLVANSWGTDWGDKGFIKILRQLTVETAPLSGEPILI